MLLTVALLSALAMGQACPPSSVISAGGYHTLIVQQNGTVLSSGYNNKGHGLGDLLNRSTPERIFANAMSGVISVSANSHYHSLALKNDGTVIAWGLNDLGQLGIGNTTNQSAPQPIAAGVLSSVVALRNNGTVMAWGYNGFGQIGNGTNTLQTIPMQVSPLLVSSVIAVAAGSHPQPRVEERRHADGVGLQRLRPTRPW